MQTAIQTTATKKALEFLELNRYRVDIEWDNPTPECFQIFQVLLDNGLLVDRRGQKCNVINRYGPNPNGLVEISDINRMYLGW